MGNIYTRTSSGHHAPRNRKVVPNHAQSRATEPNFHPNGAYQNNIVRTTKYTVWSFVPKNIFEQFHRFANIYFLFIVLLNFVPQVNAVSPGLATVPVIGVLLVTAIKDAYEDYRRHRQDKSINHQPCRVYHRDSGGYELVEWQDVLVGDIVCLSCNEIIPADIILLNTSNENGLCFVETSNLDGESNLKQRQVVKSFHEGEEFSPKLFTHSIECDLPNVEINRFNGFVTNKLDEKIAVNKENLLLRGCALRNTQYVEGIVVYAGHDTKALLNNRGPRYKRSKLERQINLDIIWCVIALFLMCFSSALGTGLFAERFHHVRQTVLFIPYIDESTYSVPYQGFIRFLTYIILYQVMIPLPLYASIELVKLIQVYFISNDLELYYEENDRPMECRALNITEDLGQIEHIFSDKTGTLTENKMVMKKCTIFGELFFENNISNEDPGIPAPSKIVNPDEMYRQIRETEPKEDRIICDPRLRETILSMTLESALAGRDGVSKIHEFFLHLTICNTVVVTERRHQQEFTQAEDCSDTEEDHFQSSDGSYNRFPSRSSAGRRSVRRANDLSSAHSATQPPSSGSSNFEAESPDELAFVIAANAHSCKLVGRSPSSVNVDMPGEPVVTLKVLHVLPFDSTRKRMSVIFQNPLNKETILYVKGADSAIFPHLHKFEAENVINEMVRKTRQQIENYARQGYRTLCMAKRVIPADEYDAWRLKHKAAELAFEDRENLLFDLACEIEKDLQLIGATGIEDKLQDGVPETIASLKEAGINVWVLTGDNQDTALNIAYSCHLISYEQDIIVLNASSKDNAKELISSRLEELSQRESHTNPALENSSVDVRESSINPHINGHINGPSNSSLQYSLSQRSLEEYPQRTNSSSYRSFQWRGNTALVIDGPTLAYLLDANLEEDLLKLTNYCSSVLCVRATPFQKAALVKLVRNGLGKMTLAIGDGANDVSMIQTADIGIGISGQEGMQAIMASDFAIARFRFLKRLLFVHGHWCYDRLARMTLYMWYKNAVFVFLLMWFQIYSGFSGSAFVDDFNLLAFNTVYTSLPPILYGIVDQCVSDHLLMKYPRLYERGQKGKIYTSFSYLLCIIDAIWQSLVQFFIPYAVYYNSSVGVWEMSQTCNAACVITALAQLCLETRYWHPLHLIFLILSLLVFFILNFVICGFEPKDRLFLIIFKAMATPQYWFSIIVAVVVSLFPRYLWHVFQGTFFPSLCERAQQIAAKKTVDDSFIATWSSETSSASVVIQGVTPLRELAEGRDVHC